MERWLDGWMGGWVDGWMNGWMDGCADSFGARAGGVRLDKRDGCFGWKGVPGVGAGRRVVPSHAVPCRVVLEIPRTRKKKTRAPPSLESPPLMFKRKRYEPLRVLRSLGWPGRSGSGGKIRRGKKEGRKEGGKQTRLPNQAWALALYWGGVGGGGGRGEGRGNGGLQWQGGPSVYSVALVYITVESGEWCDGVRLGWIGLG